jgi:hypothetical protein
MSIQPIEPISIADDYTYYQSAQPVSSVPSVGKKANVGEEQTPYISENAKRLLKIDQQMGQVENAISSVKEKLTTLRRTVPPFPPGSQEWVRFLKSILGLRKLIEELTVPPDVTLKEYIGGIHIPELGNQATEKDVDPVLAALDKAVENIRQKKASQDAGVKA